MKKALFSIALLAVSASVFAFADALEHIRKAPDLAYEVPGKGQQTLAQYKGKVVALEFIYTTCPHCQAASRVMSKLQTEYGQRGLQVVDIAINPNADLLVENFAKDYQVNFPVGWTTQNAMQSFMAFGDARYVVPQLVIIDRKGMIHYQTPPTSEGNDNWGKLMAETAIRQHIEQLLAQ